MTEHTPGPWHFTDTGNANIGRRYMVTHTYSTPDRGPGTEWEYVAEARSEADARLIAAAPDLLTAAEYALEAAESWIHDQLDSTHLLDDELADLQPVRDTIAKARGQ